MTTLKKNSWLLSIKNTLEYHHYYFCICSKEFSVKTGIDALDTADILCPTCGNDYFKDADEFENIKGVKIWKYFGWDIVEIENEDYWSITLQYEVATYCDKQKNVRLQKQNLLSISLPKDGSSSFNVSYTSEIISKYSLFFDDKVQAFKKLLLDNAKDSLCKLVLSRKTQYVNWLKNRNLLSIKDRLIYIREIAMLDFILRNRQEKSLKKALYRAYETSIHSLGYYPYSDYIFSKTIHDINLLVKLYSLEPIVKQYIFTNETYPIAIKFIEFLKQHYTEKQIAKLFLEEMQNEVNYKIIIELWRDTLRMFQQQNILSLNKHYIKVKLTSRKLHDEIVRASHVISYELDTKESFEYDKKYLSACGHYKELEFRLPDTVKELSLWARKLHNCMFGYSKRIHQQQSVIFGELLLYAVELSGFKVVQAKAVSNNIVPVEDMSIINHWQDTLYNLHRHKDVNMIKYNFKY